MNASKPQLQFIFINGGPASGKDTQSALLVKDKPDAKVISPGQILREAVDPSSEIYSRKLFGDPTYIKKLMSEGKNVNGRVLTKGLFQLVGDAVKSGFSTFVFAGWPRERGSLDYLQFMLHKLREQGVFSDVSQTFVELRVSKENMIRRTTSRREKHKRDRLSIRNDDEPDMFETRFRTYTENAVPILSELESQGALIVIDANGAKDETQHKLREALKWDIVRGIEAPHATLPPQARR